MSLNGALATASRSLQLFSLGIQVSGNNIANASSPGYVRDELRTVPSPGYQTGGVILGTGALADGVHQQLDAFLESRIHGANSDASAAEQITSAYTQLQQVLQELGDQDLSTGLNTFLNAIQTVADQPENPSVRSALISQGENLSRQIQSLRGRVVDLKDSANSQLKSLVSEANSLIVKVADLNPKIARLEANGLNHNDASSLRIERLNSLNRLSQIIPIRVVEQSSGAVDVYSGAEYVMLGGSYQTLTTSTQPDEKGLAITSVEFSRTRAVIEPLGGELHGLIDGRDKVNESFLEQLDQLTGALIHTVNRVHSSGQGLSGLTDTLSNNYVSSSTVALDQAALPFAVESGRFVVSVRNKQTGLDDTHEIAIDLRGLGTDTTLDDVRAALGAISHVTATVTAEKKLSLKTDNGYELRFGEDTSGFLAAAGINTFFTGSGSGDIAVSKTLIGNPELLATGQGGGPSDNRNALKLVQEFDAADTSLQGFSIDDYYRKIVGTIAQSGAAEQAVSDGFASFRDTLKAQREQRSGVSLDEETINVLNLQHNYQAAAKIVSTIDQLMTTLLQI